MCSILKCHPKCQESYRTLGEKHIETTVETLLNREQAMNLLGITDRQFRRYLNGHKAAKLLGLIQICPEYFEERQSEFDSNAMKCLTIYQKWSKKKRTIELEQIALKKGFPYG